MWQIEIYVIRYQKLLNGPVGSEDCQIRKAIETKTTHWTEFEHACMINKPTFDDN